MLDPLKPIKYLYSLLTGNLKNARRTGILIVGMGTSAKYGKCPGANHDAGTMLGILSKYGKPTVLQDRQATKAAVINALTDIIKNNDLAIFFYSGHGGSDPIGNIADEPDGRNEYLCLYDGYLLDNEIWNIVNQARDRVFLIFDCCHSATMFRCPGIDFDILNYEDDAERIEYGLSPRSPSVNMLCWSGCPDDNYSYGDDNGGVLTNAIKKGYTKSSTYSEVWGKVKTYAKSQKPQKTQIGKGFGGRIFR